MSFAGGLPRAWDAFDVYLFDIDGTLLHCADAVHYFAFCNALESIAGRPLTLEGVVAHGNTDMGILRDAFALAGVDEGLWRPRLAEITQAMCEYVRVREPELCTTVLRGVRRVLEYLRNEAILGIATGNLRAIGELKLGRAGLLSFFAFGGWSDGLEFRADVFSAAVAQAREIGGDKASICVVGDTPADISASHQNGVPIISVATGIYSFETLSAEGPELCVRSLEDLFACAQALPA